MVHFVTIHVLQYSGPHYLEAEYCHLGYPFLNYQIMYFTYSYLSFTERAFVLLFQRFSSFVKHEIFNFLEYFVIEKHFLEQIFLKVEPESFLYEFLNPIPHGVFWVTHTSGGRFYPSAITQSFQTIWT